MRAFHTPAHAQPYSTTATIQAGSPSPLSPYHALALPLPPAVRRDIATSWADGLVMQARVAARSEHERLRRVRQRGFTVPAADRRLRIGFLSRRFERYPGL